MNKLDLAMQGFKSLAAELNLQLDEVTSDRAERWLSEEVGPVCQELVEMRSFQLAACWSAAWLEPGAKTRQRKLVEAVDEALVQLASEVARVTVADCVESPPSDGTVTARVAVDAGTQQTLKWVASRPWFDLVSPEEYFQAAQGLHLNHSHLEQSQRFSESRELRVPLGDYVARSLLARVEYWQQLLVRHWDAVFANEQLDYAAKDRLLTARLTLDEAIKQLKQTCFSEKETRLREVATTLTQVYAAYATAPRLEWLGFPPGSGLAERGMIRAVVRRPGTIQIAERDAAGSLQMLSTRQASLCDPSVLRHIAAALADGRAFYEAPEDADDLVDWYQNRARLLLVDRSPRQVFWDGTAIADGLWDNGPREWNLLWMLAQHAPRTVDQQMLMKPDGEAIRSRRSRLAKLLGESIDSLDQNIETVRRHGYRLKLSGDEVALLRDDGTGRLVVVNAVGVTR